MSHDSSLKRGSFEIPSYVRGDTGKDWELDLGLTKVDSPKNSDSPTSGKNKSRKRQSAQLTDQELKDKLRTACKNQNPSIAKTLLHLLKDRKINIDFSTENIRFEIEDSALLFACKIVREDLALKVLQEIHSTNILEYVDSKGVTPLIRACEKNMQRVVKKILEIWNELSTVRNTQLLKCLFVATMKSNVGMMFTLLDFVKDSHCFHAYDKEGKTVLQRACENENSEIFGLLFDKWIVLYKKEVAHKHHIDTGGLADDVDRATMVEETVLHILGKEPSVRACYRSACITGNIMIMVKLINEFDYCKLVFEDGESGLTIAHRNGHPEAVDILIESIAAEGDIDTRLQALHDSFVIACNMQLTSLAEKLDAKLVSMVADHEHPYLCVSLFFMCESQGGVNLFKSMLDRRKPVYQYAYLTTKNALGRTMLFVACYHGNNEIAEYLIKCYNAQGPVDDETFPWMRSLKVTSEDRFDALAASHDDDASVTSGADNRAHRYSFYVPNQREDEHENTTPLIDIPDDAGATPLLVACLNGHSLVLSMLIENGADVTPTTVVGPPYDKIISFLIVVSEGKVNMIWPVIAACACPKKSGVVETVFDMLSPAVRPSLLLKVACKFGTANTVEYLLSHNAAIMHQLLDDRPFNPLIIAADRGEKSVVKRLLEFGADINLRETRVGTIEEHTALTVACDAKNFEIVAFLIERGVKITPNVSAKLTHFQEDLRKLTALEKIAAVDTLKIYALAHHGGHSFFKVMDDFLLGGENPRTAALLGLYDISNYQLVTTLVKIACYIKLADKHTGEEGLHEQFDLVFQTIVECMKSESMFNLPQLASVVLSTEKVYELSSEGDIMFELIFRMFKEGPVKNSIQYQLLSFLATSPMLRLFNQIYFAPFTPKYFYGDYKLPSTLRRQSIDKELYFFRGYDSLWIISAFDISFRMHHRYCPNSVVIFEGLMQIWTLCLVGFVAVRNNNNKFHMGGRDLLTSEILLIIQAGTEILYELGFIKKEKWNFIKYVRNDIWNCIDLVAVGMVAMWAVLRLIPSNEFVIESGFGSLTLCLACIPLSISILRYLIISRKVGKLVLMIFEMAKEVARFMLVFFMSVFGFGIVFYGFYPLVNEFRDIKATSVTLFSAAMGAFDLSIFEGVQFGRFGQLLMVLFIMWSLILLLNLVIARMTVIHDRIDVRALDRHAYYIALNCQQYSIVNENTPMAMLPPPFNILPILVTPLHYFFISKGRKEKRKSVISMCGTVCDKIVAVIVVHLMLPWDYLRIAFYMIAAIDKTQMVFNIPRVMHNLRLFLLMPLDIYFATLRLIFREPCVRISIYETRFEGRSPSFRILSKMGNDMIRMGMSNSELYTQMDKDRIFYKALQEIDRNLDRNIANRIKKKIAHLEKCDELDRRSEKMLNAADHRSLPLEEAKREIHEIMEQIRQLREDL